MHLILFLSLGFVLVVSNETMTSENDPGRNYVTTTTEIPILIAKVNSGTTPERQAALLELARIGQNAKEAVPVLVVALSDKNWINRWLAAEALLRIGPAAQPAIPALTATLRDREGPTACIAGLVLTQLGTPAVPSLMKALTDSDPISRQLAANALGGIGSNARIAVPTLRKVLQNEQHEVVRQRINEAIEKITNNK